MFNKLKQLKQLRDLQKSLQNEKVEIEKNGIKVLINGKLEIEEIKLNPELDKEEQEKILRDCINEAVKKIQTFMVQKISQAKDFEIN